MWQASAFSTPPVVPITNGYVMDGYGGQTQLPPPFSTPPVIPTVHVRNEQNTGTVASIDPFAGISQSLDSSNTSARKRFRRNALRATGGQPSYLEQPAGEGDFSTDIAVLSDPHLQAMIQQYSQKGHAS